MSEETVEATTTEANEHPDAGAPPAEEGGHAPVAVHPWRLALALLMIPILALVIMRDTGSVTPDQISLALSEKVGGLGEWATTFSQRLLTSGLKITLVIMIIVAIAYILLQWFALLLLDAPRKPGANLLRALSGRALRISDPDAYRVQMRAWGQWAALSPLRAGLSVFPMVGFLGTVVGLSTAIRDLPAAINNSDQLGPVLDSLYVAFDTTLLGLVGAIVCLVAVRLFEDWIEVNGRSNALS